MRSILSETKYRLGFYKTKRRVYLFKVVRDSKTSGLKMYPGQKQLITTFTLPAGYLLLFFYCGLNMNWYVWF